MRPPRGLSAGLTAPAAAPMDRLRRTRTHRTTALNLPPITLGLIIACVAAFLGQQQFGAVIEETFALWPIGPNFHIWQLVSYFFLHGGVSHILFNMLGLAMFGAPLERIWGPRKYISFVLVATIAAGLTQLAIEAWTGGEFPTVGASGGIYGLLLGFALIFPNSIITPLFPPIPMRARTFAFVFAGIELFSGVTGTMAGVAHFAHLGGMLGGYLMLMLWRLEGANARR